MKVKIINLYFPLSSNKKFKLFYNEAMQSEFIKNIISFLEDDNTEYYFYNVEIPKALYKNLREIDLIHFIELLKGNDYLTEFQIKDNNKYNYNSIARISQSLLLNEELKFVNILEKYFPPIV